MIVLLVPHYDALELFCAIIKKYESSLNSSDSDILTSSEYTSEKFVTEALSKYTNPDLCKYLGKQILKIKKTKRTSDNTKTGKFYNLVKSIRENDKVLKISKSDLYRYYAYILRDPAPINQYSILKPLEAHQKQYQFQGTLWWIFCFDIIEGVNPGVTKSILTFDPFGKSTIINYEVEQETTERYKGSYEIFDNRFIKMEMKLEGNAKDLHLLFFIGNTEPEKLSILMGQYHNVGDKIYSGVAILTRMGDGESKEIRAKIDEKKDLKADVHFFKQASNYQDIKNEIDPGVWTYLKNKKNNLIDVPCKIISDNRLITLHEEREREN